MVTVKLTVFVCVLLTVWSAVNAYSTKQGAAILAAQASQNAYASALADEKAACATLGRITETSDADELAKLQGIAEADKAKACRRPRSEGCKTAEATKRRSPRAFPAPRRGAGGTMGMGETGTRM